MTNHKKHLEEDVEFLIGTGEWPERIAKRLGFKSWLNLERGLQNRGRHDLTKQLRLIDRSSPPYQLAHNTPMDEVVARGRKQR